MPFQVSRTCLVESRQQNTMSESNNSSNPRRKRKRKKPPAGASKRAALTGAAGGALVGAIATRAVDRAANAIESGVAKAAERHFNRKSDNTWEEAAKNVG